MGHLLAQLRICSAITVALSGMTSGALALDVVAPGALPAGTVLPQGSTITGSGALSSPSSITLGTSPSDRITASVSVASPYLSVAAGLTGPGGLIKNGIGTLELAGAVNDYSGPTLINDGYLILSADTEQAFASDLLGSGTIMTSGYGSTVVRYTGDASAFTGNYSVNFYASAVFAGPTNPAGVNLKGDGRYYFNGRTIAVSSALPPGTGGLSVYGGGLNQNVASSNVILSGAATTVGAIRGGGRGGDVLGNVNISVTGGAKATGVVYGGGFASGDDVGGNTTVLVSGSGMTLTEVRGGGGTGTRVSGDTSVTVADGVRVGTVYGGGGLGAANTNVVVRGAATAADYVYGGGGTISGNTSVRITDGANVYQKAYGGGGTVEGDSSIVVSGGARVSTVFGGVTSSSTVRNSTVSVEGAGTTVNTVYGGGDGGRNFGLASVNVSGGAQITGTLYGGGLNSSSGSTGTRVSLAGTGTWANVAYGGGGVDSVAGDSIVALSDGATVGTLYGAGRGNSAVYWCGTVQNATITLSGSGTTAGSVYGGGQWGTTTGTATINLLDSATVTSVLSGKSEFELGTPGPKILNLGMADAAGQRYHGAISASISGFDRISIAEGSEAGLDGTVASTVGRIDVYGTLGGSGILAAPITVYSTGSIAPGSSPGTLTLNSTLALTSGATLEMEPGDALVLNGSVSGLSNATLDLIATEGTFTISQLFAGSYAPASFDAFSSVIANGGFNTVTFNPDHTSVTVAVPEPGVVMLGLAVSTAALSFRKRRVETDEQ